MTRSLPTLTHAGDGRQWRYIAPPRPATFAGVWLAEDERVEWLVGRVNGIEVFIGYRLVEKEEAEQC